MLCGDQAEAKDLANERRTLVSGLVEGWDASVAFPLASVRSSLGQTGCLRAEQSQTVRAPGKGGRAALHCKCNEEASGPGSGMATHAGRCGYERDRVY